MKQSWRCAFFSVDVSLFSLALIKDLFNIETWSASEERLLLKALIPRLVEGMSDISLKKTNATEPPRFLLEVGVSLECPFNSMWIRRQSDKWVKLFRSKLADRSKTSRVCSPPVAAL